LYLIVQDENYYIARALSIDFQVHTIKLLSTCIYLERTENQGL